MNLAIDNLPYLIGPQNRDNKPYNDYLAEKLKYKGSDFQKYGQLAPSEDPGLQSNRTSTEVYEEDRAKGVQEIQFTPEQVQRLDREAKEDTDGFGRDLHLPKGIFQAGNEPRALDASKKNLVISLIEDEKPTLLKTLDALDRYFKLDTAEVQSITDRFNVQIAWSTSMEDCMKALRVAGDRIKASLDKGADSMKSGLEEAKVFFLNDMNFNMGTGPNFNLFSDMNNLGMNLSSRVKEVFNITDANTAELRQTSDRKKLSSLVHLDSDTARWAHLEATRIPKATNEIALRFSRGETTGVNKLAKAVDASGSSDPLRGISIPVQAFVRFIDGNYKDPLK